MPKPGSGVSHGFTPRSAAVFWTWVAGVGFFATEEVALVGEGGGARGAGSAAARPAIASPHSKTPSPRFSVGKRWGAVRYGIRTPKRAPSVAEFQLFASNTRNVSHVGSRS